MAGAVNTVGNLIEHLEKFPAEMRVRAVNALNDESLGFPIGAIAAHDESGQVWLIVVAEDPTTALR